MIKFKLYPKEHIDKQREKHQAYVKSGFELTKQHQQKDGLVVREYAKKLK